jgi:hypothetical protein
MVPLLLAPTVLSFLVLAAHYFYHAQLAASVPDYLLCAGALLMPVALAVRSRFILWALQCVLVLAAVEWGATALETLRNRLQDHAPYRAAMIILLGVAAWNLLSAALLGTRPLKIRYSASGSGTEGESYRAA